MGRTVKRRANVLPIPDSARSYERRSLWVKLKIGDSIKVLEVARQEHETVLESGDGDEQVWG